MKVRVLAVSSRVPGWVREAYDDYVTRLNPKLKISLVPIEPGPRSAAISAQRGRSGEKAMAAEGQRLLGALRPDEYVVVLDEHGDQMTTRELASWLAMRMQSGDDLVFVIGGPDGLAPEVLARGDFKWALSRLTLPHALVRVVLAEQLYRAHGVLNHHPYHRE